MKKSLLTASSMLVTLALAGFTAAAQETVESSSQSTTKIEDVKESNKVTDDVDVDEVITNKKMRAESGSKSKWSIGTSLNYSGSTVKAPLKPSRPNIAAGAGVPAFALLEHGDKPST